MQGNPTDDHGEFGTYLCQLKRFELSEYLQNLQEPVWECELMRVACPNVDLVAGEPLEMYRWHFVLFHVLYLMVPEFFSRGFYLHIHFMRTFVLRFPETDKCRHFDCEATAFCGAACIEDLQYCSFHSQRVNSSALDQLSERYFYLNKNNFTALKAEDAEKFMSGAWQLLQNHDDYRACLAVMGLPDGVSLDLLKKRFRHLARTMHPDISSDHNEEFTRINDAYRRLLAYLGGAVKKI